MNLSENIKKIRLIRGYKQEYVAQKIGVSQKQYSKYENTDANLEWKTIEKIAVALEIDLVNLISFDESKFFDAITSAGSTDPLTTIDIYRTYLTELINQLKIKDAQIKLLLEKIK